MLDAIANAVSAKTSFRVYFGSGIGIGIINANNPRPYQLGANDKRAQDVLLRALTLLSGDMASATTDVAAVLRQLPWRVLLEYLKHSRSIVLVRDGFSKNIGEKWLDRIFG